jgi:hypothetical protein
MSKWIKIVGEAAHKCDLPWAIDAHTMSGTQLQKRHSGSIWECDCGERYEWDGKDFSGPM